MIPFINNSPGLPPRRPLGIPGLSPAGKTLAPSSPPPSPGNDKLVPVRTGHGSGSKSAPAKVIAALLLFLIFGASAARGESLEGIKCLLGPGDAVLVEDAEGRTILSRNADKLLIPASILKVFTSLSALYYLGEEYRFTTEFYLDERFNLGIKGYGDPLLVSETVKRISLDLARRLPSPKALGDIVTDGSYYTRPLFIPGTFALSSQPYDAPNGALCVNFNTVNFRYDNGAFKSNEQETPLLPSVMETVRRSGLKKGRVLLPARDELPLRYAGELFAHFLGDAGIKVEGRVKTGRIDKAVFKRVHTHGSDTPLTEVIRGLLRYSNNFTANQLLLNMGAKVYGPPATLEKGVSAMGIYAEKILGMSGFTLVEGSGISRQNRISAAMAAKALEAFKPHYRLMQKKGRVYYKTGTLFGISTRAGYILTPEGRPGSFVVMINTPGRHAGTVTRKIERILGAP